MVGRKKRDLAGGRSTKLKGNYQGGTSFLKKLKRLPSLLKGKTRSKRKEEREKRKRGDSCPGEPGLKRDAKKKQPNAGKELTRGETSTLRRRTVMEWTRFQGGHWFCGGDVRVLQTAGGTSLVKKKKKEDWKII